MSFDHDSIQVTLLGTGYPAPRIDRFGPSTLVEAGGQRFLFDCGRGTMQRIYQIDTDASSFDKLFLTHLHSDHTTGIPDLWITGMIQQRTNNPLRVWGPKGTTQMIEYLKKAFDIDVKVRKQLRDYHQIRWDGEGLRIETQDIDENFVFEEDGVKVIPFRVNHHDFYSDEPSFGYRVEYQDRSVVISGDTCYCENLVKYSENVDLLIHAVAATPLSEERENEFRLPLSHHTSPEECGRIFSEVKPRLAVYHHVIPFQGVSLEEIMNRTKKAYSGSVVFGEDLMQIDVGDTVQILNP